MRHRNMAKLRTGPTYTQEILSEFINAVKCFGNSDEHPDTAFRHVTQALQRFLHHGMSRFSVETLQYVLDDLILVASREKGTDPFSIRSLTQLRAMVKTTMMRREAGSLRASDANALRYIETFFYCVYCLSEAKRMFDEIYENLYFTYFDPKGFSRQPTKVSSAHDKERLTGRDDYSQFGISTLQQMTGSTLHKLRQTAGDMKDVLGRWGQLLTDEEPDPSSFDPESDEDLHLLHGVSGSEPILRLVPDLFAKYYKCTELTKQWWVLAHDAYPDVMFQRRPSQSDTDVELDMSRASSSGGDNDSVLSDRPEATNDEIETTKVMIIENQKIIHSLQEEIVALDKREERFEILKETYEKVGKEIQDKKKEQKRLRVARDQLNADESKEVLSSIHENLHVLDSSLRLLEFQHALLLEDFMIHLEIRPSIIRFQDDAKMHLKEAQTTREKHMTHLQKLRDAFNTTPLHNGGVNTPHLNNSIPNTTNPPSGPGNSRTTPPSTSNDGRNNNEKRNTTHTKSLLDVPVDKNEKIVNQLRRDDGKEEVIVTQSPTDKIRQMTSSSKSENTARPMRKRKESEIDEIASKADVEMKSNILKRTNSKQSVESANLTQNVSSKTISKKRFDEQQKLAPSEHQLRRTYDLSNHDTTPKPKRKEREDSQKVDKNDQTTKTVSMTTRVGSIEESHSHRHNNPQCRGHSTRVHPKSRSRSTSDPNGKPEASSSTTREGVPKAVGKKGKEQQQHTTAPTNVRISNKKAPLATNASLSVKSQ